MMEIPMKYRAWLVVFGGVLVHLTLGTVYTFGNMTPYIGSYIRARSKPDDVTYSQLIWTFALMLVGQGGTMFIGGYIARRLGPRWTTLLGGWIMSAGVLLTAITIKWSFYLMLLTYGFIFGCGVGIAYASPLACAMKWMPERKGLVNGIVVGGFGAGAFIFDQIQTAFINPQNDSPDQHVKHETYFTQTAILDQVTPCFILLGCLYAGMQFFGSVLLVDPPDSRDLEPLISSESGVSSEKIKEHSSVGGRGHAVANVKPAGVLRSRHFYILWATFLVNGQGVVFISSLYKAYGQTFIHDDHFLALVGAFAAVFNAGGRIAWGHMADRYSYKTAMLWLTTLMAVLMLTMILPSYLPKDSTIARTTFFIWVCCIFGTFSGSFALLPTATARTFGQDYVAVNYGLVFTSQVITGPLGAFLAATLQEVIHWFGMFCLVAGFSFIGFLLTIFFNAKMADGKTDV